MPEITDDLLDKDGDIFTNCKDCGFSIFDELELTQVGCKLNRVEKFREQGLTEELETDGIAHSRIKTVCNTFRDKAWVAIHERPVTKVLEQVRTTVDLIIVCDKSYDDKPIFIAHILSTINQINEQKQPPDNVIFVFPNKQPISFKEINELIDSSVKVPHQIVRVFENLTPGGLVDLGVNRCKSLYYITFSLGAFIPKDAISSIDRAINKKLKRFVLLLSPDKFNGLVVQRLIHNLVCGNKDTPVWEKIQELARLQENNEIIKDLKDI